MSQEKVATTKLDIIDEDLESLVPKQRAIMIGNKKHDIDELVATQYNILIDVVVNIFMAIYKMGKENDVQEDDALYQAKIIQIVAKDIIPILHVATGMSEEEIGNKITSKQIAYAARVLWEMNAKDLMLQIKDIRDIIKENFEIFETVRDGIDDTAGTPLE